MASGKPCAKIGPFSLPETSPGGEDVLLGGSTNEEKVRVIDLDGSAAEYVDLPLVIEGYTARGLTITGRCSWSSDTNDAHLTRIEADVRVVRTTDDVTASYSYSYTSQGASIAVADSSTDYTTEFSISIAHESGLSNGAYVILRLRRDPAHADDNTSGDAELWIDSVRVLEQ